MTTTTTYALLWDYADYDDVRHTLLAVSTDPEALKAKAQTYVMKKDTELEWHGDFDTHVSPHDEDITWVGELGANDPDALYGGYSIEIVEVV